MREYVVENEFVKAVKKAGGVAYKLTSQTTNGLPDRLVLFFPAKTVFVELKAPGRVLRPLQSKRRYQLQKLGFPVLCIDSPGDNTAAGTVFYSFVHRAVRGAQEGGGKTDSVDECLVCCSQVV